MGKSIWTAYAILLLGLLLLAAPYTFGYTSSSLILSDLISGALLLLLGLFLRRGKSSWASWATALLGVWLQFAPLLFWAPEAACYISDTLIGALAITFSILIPEIVPDTGPSVPPGWSYNPSSWPQRIPIAFLAAIGWLLSRYMAAHQLGYIDFVWDPIFGDGTMRVITSDISKEFPVPDAGLGAMAYSLEVLLTFKGGERRWRTMPWMVVLFGILVVPLSLTSILLIILQPLVVGAWCSACLLTALAMLLMMPLAIDEIAVVLQYLKHSKEKPFWRLFFEGGACPGAKSDRRTPPVDAPLSDLLKSSLVGVTVPWNLLVSALLGALLMMTPWLFQLDFFLHDFDPVLGPLVLVVSIVSMSEVVRKARRINQLLSLAILATASFAVPHHELAFAFHLLIALLLFLLAYRQGPLRETTHFNSP